MAWRRQGAGQGSHPSGRALDTTLGFKEPFVLILGQPPSKAKIRIAEHDQRSLTLPARDVILHGYYQTEVARSLFL